MSGIKSFYNSLVLKHFVWVLLAFIVVLIALAPYASKFRLDASSDSLVLENDASLKYFRQVVSKYSSADLLIVTYDPVDDLFSDAVLDDIQEFREKVLQFEQVASVISIIDVPLTQSPPVTLGELASAPRTLLDERTDRELAKREFVESQLYSDLLVSEDLSTTAIIINLKNNDALNALLDERNALRELKAEQGEAFSQEQALFDLTLEYQSALDAHQADQAQMIQNLRTEMSSYEDRAKLFLGGLPMIVVDSVAFINADVVVFGTAAIAVIILILIVAFRQFGWVVVPLVTCSATGFLIVCLLGLLNQPISVVSSNFLSLLLIITLSLNIHLIVRYREMVKLEPDWSQEQLLSETIASKFIPCIYTALTTIVAFASLIVSGIRPVIDFGIIMCLGIVVAVVTTFGLLPALSMLLKPKRVEHNRDPLSRLVLSGAQSLQAASKPVAALFVLITVAAVYGLTNLSVENRFIDYFKPETEIYQGMEQIDSKFGGTTPLDIILDAPAAFFEQQATTEQASEAEEFDEFLDGFDEPAATSGMDDDFADFDDDFDDFGDDAEETGQSANLVETSYWYNEQGVKKIQAIHADLDALAATGKVLSLGTTMDTFSNLKDAGPVDNIDLAFILNVLEGNNRETLIDPYMSTDGNQLHISIRVFETLKGLDRNQLITDIRKMLVEDHGLLDEQVNVSGMVVLYNNMLNSLFDSQIKTLGTVFVVIFLMFIILFRSASLALITVVPNIFSAAVVLGIMGIFQIPLDLMTITIAAISVGIAVDNSIHFVSRFRDEMKIKADYQRAVDMATNNVGQAMFYTTIVITAGFLIMVFSNFVPTMYFGLLTGIAMVTALIANLLMLPMLINWLKPKVV